MIHGDDEIACDAQRVILDSGPDNFDYVISQVTAAETAVEATGLAD